MRYVVLVLGKLAIRKEFEIAVGISHRGQQRGPTLVLLTSLHLEVFMAELLMMVGTAKGEHPTPGILMENPN